MRKRDPIFYTACGLLAAGIGLALAGQPIALLLVVAAYLLRPTLHAFELAPRFDDERQVQIHSRSGNVGFVAVMLAVVGFSIVRLAHGEQPDEMYLLLIIGLVARAVTNLVMRGDLQKAASVIIIVLGIVIATFVILSEGISTGSIIGLAVGLIIAVAGFLSRRYPRPVGIAVGALALAMVFWFHLYRFNSNSIAVWLLVGCMLIAAICLLGERREDAESDQRRNKQIRATLLGASTLALVILFALMSRPEKGEVGQLNKSGQALYGPVEVQSVTCEGHISYYPNGNLRSCTLGAEDTLAGQVLPKGTVVAFNSDGDFDFAFLQQPTEIQGVLCKGEGHGFQTVFHSNGKLKVAWPAKDQTVQGVPVAEYSWMADVFGDGANVSFWENGQLRSARLAESITRDGRTFQKGVIIELDSLGIVVTK